MFGTIRVIRAIKSSTKRVCSHISAPISEQEEEQERSFPLNSWVEHKAWGKGWVLRYDGDKIVVLFETVGYKTLSQKIVNEKKSSDEGRVA